MAKEEIIAQSSSVILSYEQGIISANIKQEIDESHYCINSEMNSMNGNVYANEHVRTSQAIKQEIETYSSTDNIPIEDVGVLTKYNDDIVKEEVAAPSNSVPLDEKQTFDQGEEVKMMIKISKTI
ncbi:unnamed protein product [Owenia fusiformis]|uniref:Uncharacterized protein n=1 Tax=Owenia fusiformis TaxID=6347 RepID=A0A8S4P0I8_OWEFU|nr:unnamed protein product [Owenia fusiformis]